jgi:hypothetical protein
MPEAWRTAPQRGKYRIVENRGATQVVQFDFGAGTVNDGVSTYTLTPNASQPCEVTANGTVPTTIVFGPSGVGAIRDTDGSTGYIFPVQSLSYASVVGDWNFVESGVQESGTPTHYVGKISLNDSRTGTVCDYKVAEGITSACDVDTETPNVTDRTDGGLNLNYGDGAVPVWGYRTPAGTLTLFGSNNPEGATGPTVLQTHFVAYKPQPVSTPVVGNVRKTWDVTSGSLALRTQTITAVDTAAGTYSRVYEHLPTTTDVFALNTPLTGMLHRTNRSPVYAFPFPGLGMSAAVNAPGNVNFIYSITVTRP